MRNISEQTLKTFGVHFDNYQNIHFPLKDDVETISYFGMKNMPKYLLPSGFEKSKFLYGAQQLKERGVNHLAPLYITEGYFDVMSLHDIGLQAVGLLGTELSSHHIHQIKKLGVNTLILALDQDDVGRQATIKVGYQLKQAGFTVFESVSEDGIKQTSQKYNREIRGFKDVNEAMLQFSSRLDIFKALYTQNFIEYEEEVANILLKNADKTSAEHCIEIVSKFMEHSIYARPELVLEQLEHIQKELNVTDKFINAVMDEMTEELKKEGNTMEKKLSSNVTLEKGKLLENGSAVFGIDLNGIKVSNIFVTDNDKHGLFVNMPTNKGKDGKFYPQIRLGAQIKDKVNFALIQAFTELKLGREFEPRQLPINLNDAFNLQNERFVGETNMFTLQHEHFLIFNVRHIKNDQHDFLAFEQHLDGDGKYRSHFYATKEKMSAIKQRLTSEKSQEQQVDDDKQKDDLEIE